MNKTPTAFVSYSWDDDDHKAWTRSLGERLRADGVEANLDQWSSVPGDQLPAYMEGAIASNDFVLIICTPRYKARSEAREGGVGYEGNIMTGELLQARTHRKFIPILRRGEWKDSAPAWLAGKYYVDLREGSRYEIQYQDLVTTLLGIRPAAPPVRSRATGPATVLQSAAQNPQEPVRIRGIIADEVTEPRNDGTRGSALYAVPFRLSRAVTPEWASVFEHVWNHPPQYTTMHRPGIARAYSDRIILDGTTIEEVQRYHRDTLALCVHETNRLVAEIEAKVRQEEVRRAQLSAEHRRNVRRLADDIPFD